MKMIYGYLFFLLLIPIGVAFAQSESTLDELFQQLEELEEQDKYHSGLRLVQQIIEDYPENSDAKVWECSLLLNAKYPTKDVQNCLQNIPSEFANEPLVLMTTATLYANLGDYDDARDQFKKVVELYPNNNYAEALYYTILLILDTSNTEYLDKLKEIYETTKDIRTLQNIIIFLNDREEFTEAELLLKYALEVEPENPNFLISMGVWNAKQGKLFEAEKHFLISLDKDKDNVILLNNLGLLYLELGDKTNNIEFYKKSTNFYQSVLQLDPDNDYALNGVENAQNKQGYSNKQISEIINYQLGILIIASFTIFILILYSLYHKYQNLQKLDYASKQKENKIKLILSYKIFFVIGSGLLSIPITLYLVSFAYTIPIKEGFDMSNWASMTVELAIGVTIALVILVYELSKNKIFHNQQEVIEGVVTDISSQQTDIENIVLDINSQQENISKLIEDVKQIQGEQHEFIKNENERIKKRKTRFGTIIHRDLSSIRESYIVLEDWIKKYQKDPTTKQKSDIIRNAENYGHNVAIYTQFILEYLPKIESDFDDPVLGTNLFNNCKKYSDLFFAMEKEHNWTSDGLDGILQQIDVMKKILDKDIPRILEESS